MELFNQFVGVRTMLGRKRWADSLFRDGATEKRFELCFSSVAEFIQGVSREPAKSKGLLLSPSCIPLDKAGGKIELIPHSVVFV